MAFNINAQVILSGPKNIKSVTKSIKNQLSGLTATVNIKIPQGTGRSVTALNKHLTSLNSNLSTLNTRATTANNTLKNLSSSLSGVAKGTQSFARAQKNVGTSLKNVNKQVTQATSGIQSFGKEAAQAIRRFAAFTVATSTIYGFIRSVQSATKNALEFQRELVKLQQVTGQGGKALDSVRKQVESLSVSLGIDANKLLQIGRIFAQTGQTLNQVEKSLQAVARSSLAPTFGTMESTAEGLVAALAQFNIQAKDSERVLGSLNAVSKKFAVESGDLISAIRRAGGVFAATSFQMKDPIDALNELIGVFTAVRSTTRETADNIATGLRTIFTRIQRPRTIEFLKEFGISLVDLKGNFVGIFPALKQISQGLDGIIQRGDTLTLARITEELGGIRQVGKLIPALRNFDKALRAVAVAGKGAAEGLGKDVALALQPLSKQFEQLQARFGDLVREVSRSATFQNLAKLAINTANAFITMADALRPLIPLVTSLAAVKITRGIFDFGAGFIGGLKGGGGRGGLGKRAASAVTGAGARQQAASQQQTASSMKTLASAQQQSTRATQALARVLGTYQQGLSANTGALNRVSTTNSNLFTNLSTLSRRIDTLTAAIGRASGNVISGGGGGGGRGPSGSRARRPRRGRAAGGRIRRQRGGPIPHDYVGVFLQDETSSMGRNVPFDTRQSRSTQVRSADLSQSAIRGKLSKSQKGELGKVRQLQLGPKSKAKETSLLASTLGIQQGSGLGKINPNNQFRYTLHNASLSSDTNKNIFRSIRANVVRGIQRGARKAQKQTGARTLRSVDDSLLKQIGFPNIAGRMFEGVLSRMGVPFDKNRDPGADLDFPGGLGTLGRAFGVSGTYPGDAKIKYTQAAIESLDKKVKNFIISRFQTEAFMPAGKGVAARPPRSKYLAYGKSFQANAAKYQGTQGGVSLGLVPALLTPGELVFNPQGVREAGVRNLDKFNNTGNVRDIISNVNPNNVSVVPGVGSGDTYPADLEPGSYVVKKRSSSNYTGGVFGNIQTAAHGGTIGRQRFNGGSSGGVSTLSRTSRASVKLDEIASSTEKAFNKNRRAVNKSTQSIQRGTQANQDLQSGAAGAVAALVGLGASISTLDFSSFEAGAASLTNLALLGSFLIPQLKGLGGAAKNLRRGFRDIKKTGISGFGQSPRRVALNQRLASGKSIFGVKSTGLSRLAGRAAGGAKAGVAGLVTALVADPLIEFLGSKKFGEKREIAPGVRGIEGRLEPQARTQARVLEGAKGLVSGAGFGASLGTVIAGPIGAAVGGAIGGIAGVISAQIFGPEMEVARQKEFDAFVALRDASDNVSKKFGELTRAGQQLTTVQLKAGSKSLADQATAVGEAQRLGVARRTSDEEGGLLGLTARLFGQKTGSQLLNKATFGFFGETQDQTTKRRQRESTRAAVSRVTPEQAAAATEVANNANLQLINSIGNLNPELLKTVAATGNLDVALQSADAPTRRFAAALEDMQKKALQTSVLSKATSQLKDLGEGVEADKLTDDIEKVRAAFEKGVPLATIKANLADSKTAMLGIVEEEERLQKSHKQSAATSKLLAIESAKAAAQLDTMISAFDQFGTAISQTMGKMSDAIDRANVSVEALSQTTTQIAAISKKGVFENLETALPREISGAISDIRSFAPGVQGNPFKDVESILRAQTRLPDVLRGVVANVARSQARGALVGTGPQQIIQQGAMVGNAIADGLRAQGIVLPEKLLNQLQADLGQQFQRQGEGTDIAGLLTTQGGLDRLKGIITDFSDTIRNTMQEAEKATQEFRNGLIKAANLQLNLTRQQISSQLKVNQKQFDIQDRINNVLGRTAKPGAAADRLRTQLGTILGRPSFANAGIRTVNLPGRGRTGDLITQRQQLEQQRRNLEQLKENGRVTPLLVNQLRVNAEALERNKRATELLANDISVLSELEGRAAKFAEREQAAQAGIVGFSQAVDELVMGLRSGDRDQFQRGMASFTDFVSPMRSLVLASQGRGGLLNNEQLRTLIGAISSGDARIATLLEQLPGGQDQAQAIQRNLTLGLAQRTFNQLLSVGGQPGDFADFVPIFAQELQKSINARKPIAQQIAEVGRVQIKLQEASMKRITEETVNQLRAVYQQLSIALTSFSASVTRLAERRGIPQARKGGLVRGPSHSQGGVLAELEGGEVVIPKMVSGGYTRHRRTYTPRASVREEQLAESLNQMGTGHLGYGANVAAGTGSIELWKRRRRYRHRGPGPKRPAHIEVLQTLRRQFSNEVGARNANRYLNQNYGVPIYDPATGGYPNLEAARRQYRQDQVLTRDGSGFPSGGRSPDEIMRGELAAEDAGRRGRLATRRQGSALTNRQEMLRRNRAAYEQRKAARAQRPRGSRRYRASLLAQQRFQSSQMFLYGARRAYRRGAQGQTLSREERRGLVQARAMLRRRRRFGNGGMVELEGGEYIINKRSASAIGTSNLNRLNSMKNGGAIGNLKDLEEKGMSLPERNKQTVILEELKKNSTTSLKQEKSQGLALNVLRDDMGSVKRAALTQGSIFTHDTGTHKRLDSLIPELRSIWIKIVFAIDKLKEKLGAGPLGGLIHGLGGGPKGGAGDPLAAGVPPKGAPKLLEDPLGVGEGKIRRDFKAARARFIAEGDDDPGTIFEFARKRRAEAREHGRAMLRNNWRARRKNRPRGGAAIRNNLREGERDAQWQRGLGDRQPAALKLIPIGDAPGRDMKGDIGDALRQFDEDMELINPPRFANGGFVRGPSHAQGGVPALLEGGEYVIPKRFFIGGLIKDPEMEAAQRKHQSLWGIGAIMDIIANTSTYWGSRALGAIDQPSRHPDSRANERGGRYFSTDHAKQAKLMEKHNYKYNPAALSKTQVDQVRQGTPTMGLGEELLLSSLDMFMPGMGATKVSKANKVARSGSMWRRLWGGKGKQIAASLNPKDRPPYRPPPLPKQSASGATGNVYAFKPPNMPNLQHQLGGQFAAEQMTLQSMHADVIRLVEDLSLPGTDWKAARNIADLHGFRVSRAKLYSFGPEKLNLYRKTFPQLGDDFGVRLGRDLRQPGGENYLGALYSRQVSDIAEEVVMSKDLFDLGSPRSNLFGSVLQHEFQHLATKGSSPEKMGGVLEYLRNRGEIISFAKQAAYEFALSNPNAKRFKMSKISDSFKHYKQWGRLRRANTAQDEALMMHRVARPGQHSEEWALSEQGAGRYFKEVSEFFYDNVMAPMMKGDLPPIPQSVPQGFANGGLIGMSPWNVVKAAKAAYQGGKRGLSWAGSKLAKFFGGGGKKGISDSHSRYRTLGIGTKENRGMYQQELPLDKMQTQFDFMRKEIDYQTEAEKLIAEPVQWRSKKMQDFVRQGKLFDKNPHKVVPRQSQKNWGATPKHWDQNWDQGFATGGLVQYRALGGIMNPMNIMSTLRNQIFNMAGGLFGGMRDMGKMTGLAMGTNLQNLLASLFGPRNAMGGPGGIGNVMKSGMDFFFGGAGRSGGAGMLDFIKGGGLGGAASHFGTSPMYSTPFGGGSSFMAHPMFLSQGGGPRGSDTVPAWLTPGEFVMRKKVVDGYGIDKMKEINNGTAQFMNQGGPVRYMAAGGPAGPGQGGFSNTALDPINSLNTMLANLERALQNMPTVPEGIDLNLRGESFIRMASDSNITEKFKEEFTANYLEAIKGPQGTRPDGSRPDPTISRLI